jgi:diadenosine tetraphosphate (Ap4A) HIT family hydrolase
MPESAEEVYERIVAQVGRHGRLPMPASASWDIFPWEVVDGAIVPKVIPPPSDEPARQGADELDPDRVVWEDERWVLTHPGKPSGLPIVLQLQPRDPEDAGEIDDDMASEMGRIINRLVRIIENLPHIGRVHVCRWGDGGSRLHVWFFARTEGLTNVLGSAAAEWNDIIPPGPEDVWRADLHTIANKLANWGGEARA